MSEVKRAVQPARSKLVVPKKSKVSVESFMHRHAKELLAGWLREEGQKAAQTDHGYATYGSISWRSNRSRPPYGVWVEYPFMPGSDGGAPGGYLWDEWANNGFKDPVEMDEPSDPDDHAGWEVWMRSLEWELKESLWRERPPTYDELAAERRWPEIIVDIAVQNKGAITSVVEIYHRHQISEQKLEILLGKNPSIDVYQVPANWVMSQVQRPEGIPEEFLLYRWPRIRC